MRHRDVRTLKEGDKLVRKYDKLELTVVYLEFLGNLKVTRIHCVDSDNNKIYVYDFEVDQIIDSQIG